MDPKLLEHYVPRKPAPAMFIRETPVARTRRPTWPLVLYSVLLGVAMTGCIASLLVHLSH